MAKDKFFLLCEFLSGRSLEDKVLTDGPLSEPRAVTIIMKALEGLQAVHDANLVHRDIKPDNIILMKMDTPKIIDFGMAKGRRVVDSGTAMATAGMMTLTDMVAGSPEYMAPEQWAGVETQMYVCGLFESVISVAFIDVCTAAM